MGSDGTFHPAICTLSLDWSKVAKRQYLAAMIVSTGNPEPLKHLLKSALTDQVSDRELFMKGIDYSYYYEQDD